MSVLIGKIIMPHCEEDGGTESLGVTAGETENPARNMPRVIKFVFWRYVITLLERSFTLEQAYPTASFYSTSSVSY
jgi:AAT family amino acid transporter